METRCPRGPFHSASPSVRLLQRRPNSMATCWPPINARFEAARRTPSRPLRNRPAGDAKWPAAGVGSRARSLRRNRPRAAGWRASQSTAAFQRRTEERPTNNAAAAPSSSSSLSLSLDRSPLASHVGHTKRVLHAHRAQSAQRGRDGKRAAERMSERTNEREFIQLSSLRPNAKYRDLPCRSQSGSESAREACCPIDYLAS